MCPLIINRESTDGGRRQLRSAEKSIRIQKSTKGSKNAYGILTAKFKLKMRKQLARCRLPQLTYEFLYLCHVYASLLFEPDPLISVTKYTHTLRAYVITTAHRLVIRTFALKNAACFFSNLHSQAGLEFLRSRKREFVVRIYASMVTKTVILKLQIWMKGGATAGVKLWRKHPSRLKIPR